LANRPTDSSKRRIQSVEKNRKIMKTATKVIYIMLFTLGLCASAFAIHETVPSETQITLPGPNAAALYKYITQSDPYTRWKLWPGKGKLYKGVEPHGSLLTTYVNDTAYRSAKGKSAMTDGAIIVKENYTSDKKLVALTVMYKIKGYNPANNDWFWARFAADGKTEVSGKAEACIKCHINKKENDYIFSAPLR
jgi:hypothetical protein